MGDSDSPHILPKAGKNLTLPLKSKQQFWQIKQKNGRSRSGYHPGMQIWTGKNTIHFEPFEGWKDFLAVLVTAFCESFPLYPLLPSKQLCLLHVKGREVFTLQLALGDMQSQNLTFIPWIKVRKENFLFVPSDLEKGCHTPQYGLFGVSTLSAV